MVTDQILVSKLPNIDTVNSMCGLWTKGLLNAKMTEISTKRLNLWQVDSMKFLKDDNDQIPCLVTEVNNPIMHFKMNSSKQEVTISSETEWKN